MRNLIGVGLYAAALVAACSGGQTGSTGGTQTGGTREPPPPPEPAISCNHSQLSEAYLAGSDRARELVGDRRKVGVIPVKLTVDDCHVELEVLERCNMPGFYAYRPQSKMDRKTLQSEQDLFNEMPTAADSFVHKISAGNAVKVDFKIVGELATSSTTELRKQDLEGERCIEATHYISKIYVGGFAAGEGSIADLSGAGELFGNSSPMVFTQEGEVSACESGGETVRRYPHELCSVPLKVSLSTFSSGKSDKNKCAHDLCEAGGALESTCNTCTEAVCKQADYCCKSHWDGGCIAKAKQLCKSPCSGCEHDLCKEGTKLDATCDPCAQKVCAADSYCCNNKWDKSCVRKALQLCGKCGEGLHCLPGFVNKNGKCVCATGKVKKGSKCVTPASCDHDVCVSGGPLLTSCNSCTAAICKKDSFCCNNRWDSTCLKKVKQFCGKTCPCDKYGSKGKCQGNVLNYCIGGKVKTVDCSKNSGSKRWCGYNPKTQYASCQKKSDGGGRVGQTCSQNSQCRTHLCSGGKCVRSGIELLKKDGHPCVSNAECRNKSCFVGKCQQPQ